MRYLKENTATRVTVGPFLDVTNGYTPEIALTATNEHITFIVDDLGVPTLVIDAVATVAGANDLVHITSDIAGYYDLELTAAQTNYTGRAMLSIHYDTDHLPVFHEFQIVSANVYDSLFTDGDVLDVNTIQISGTTQTANDVGNDVDAILLDTGELQADWVNGGRLDLLIDAIKAVTDVLPNSGTLSSLALEATAQTILTDTGTTLQAELDAIQAAVITNAAGVDIAADIAAVKAETASIVGDTGTDGVVISTATAQAIADELLKRDFTAVTGEAARSTLNALRFLRNKWSITGGTLTVTEEDDATAAWTATVTTDAAADPVTGNDPA